MSFYSLLFLIIFIPVCMGLYYITPGRLRCVVLLGVSLVFYFTLERVNILLLLASVFFDYFMASVIHYYRDKPRIMKMGLALSVIKTLLLAFLCLVRARTQGAAMPVGVLVYTLSATGYCVDLFRGEIEYERKFLKFLLYNCFFGRIFAGPYVKYSVIRPQLGARHNSPGAISTGLVLIIQGLAKRVILADNLMAVYSRLLGGALAEPREQTVLSAWIMVSFFSLGLVFTLWSLCDMARGLGLLFSFKLPRNVFYPFTACSVREFLGAFNATLYSYLRRYVYRSLGGKKYGVLSDCLNTMLTLMLFGVWFALTPSCIAWGAFLGVFLIGEKYLYGGLLGRLPRFVGHIYTLAVLLFSFCILSSPSLLAALSQVRIMFGLSGAALWNNQIVYTLTQSWWLLILGVLFSTDVFSKAASSMKQRLPRLGEPITVVLNVALLFVSIAFMV